MGKEKRLISSKVGRGNKSDIAIQIDNLVASDFFDEDRVVDDKRRVKKLMGSVRRRSAGRIVKPITPQKNARMRAV